jgi:nicotinamide-nucleotide amidase
MSASDCLARALGELLLARGETVVTAESCTGGLIAGAITEIAGSSAWFGFGFVTYANEAKQQLLGVPEPVLAQHGAVSEAAVRIMASQALRAAKADWAIAVSGVAGPAGGSEEKPVGTVWLAWSGPAGTATELRHFSGDRHAVRQQTVERALAGLIEKIREQV